MDVSTVRMSVKGYVQGVGYSMVTYWYREVWRYEAWGRIRCQSSKREAVSEVSNCVWNVAYGRVRVRMDGDICGIARLTSFAPATDSVVGVDVEGVRIPRGAGVEGPDGSPVRHGSRGGVVVPGPTMERLVG